MDSPATRVSRRHLLAGVAAVGVVAALAVAVRNPAALERSGGLIADALTGRPSLSLATAEREDWQHTVGATFAIAHTRMRLAGVRPLPRTGPRPADVRQHPFLAVFELADGQALTGNLVYTVSTARSVEFELFLSESSDAGRLLAVFN